LEEVGDDDEDDGVQEQERESEDFDYYGHFGIDADDSGAEGALEAAMSGYSR